MNKPLRLWAFSLLVLGIAVSAQQTKQDKTTRQVWTADRQQARQAYDKKDWSAYRDAILQYHKDFPGSSHALKDLATSEAKLGNGDAALQWATQYVGRGLVLDLEKPEMAGMQKQLSESVKRNAQPVSHATRVFQLSSADLVAEDIAYDPEAKQFFISSVRQRKILRCDLLGKCTDFVTRDTVAPLWAVLAVRVDPGRRVLWATTASMQPELDHQKSEEGKSAVLKFDVRTGKLLKRYEPQDGTQHALGDMTVARNGDAFVADGLSGDLFIVRHDRDQLDPLVPGGTFLSPQTPALSADEKVLFVPDYAAGVASVNLADQAVTWIDGLAAMDGTDGLYFKDGWLIAVQNGVEPERIARFHLSGNQVDRWETVESNSPGLGDPTHGVLVGNDFYFIANSGWDRVQDDGTMKPGEAAEIRKVHLE